MKNMMSLLNKKTVLIGLIGFLFITFVLASVFIDNSQSDFDLGTYNNTLYNSSVGSGAVQLNLSFNNGTYTSQIFSTGSNVSLNNLSWEYQRIQCPEGMAYINKLNGYCIDKYEAIALNSDGSWHEESDNQEWRATGTNSTATLLAAGGYAGSKAGYYPWVYISANDARTACSRAGKHLCTSEEWLAASNLKNTTTGQAQYFNLPTTLSASPYYCVVDSSTDCAGESPGSGNACKTGGCTDNEGCGNCVSLEGVYDMTGNVWEWTNETVGYTSPPSGTTSYWNGTAWTTSGAAGTATYGNDATYFSSGTVTGKAVLRGGDWSLGARAGPFCAYLGSGPAVTYYNVGFRCCSS